MQVIGAEDLGSRDERGFMSRRHGRSGKRVRLDLTGPCKAAPWHRNQPPSRESHTISDWEGGGRLKKAATTRLKRVGRRGMGAGSVAGAR